MIPQGVEIFVATEPVDMRFGFERLGGIVRERMQREPRSRALFVFFGRRRQTVKILSWDGTGTVLWYKRLDPFWPKDRYLELAPLYWRATRAALDNAELERPAGAITVPTIVAG